MQMLLSLVSDAWTADIMHICCWVTYKSRGVQAHQGTVYVQAAKEDLLQQGWTGFYLGGNYVSGVYGFKLQKLMYSLFVKDWFKCFAFSQKNKHEN